MDLNRIVMPVFGLLFLTFLSACSGDGDTSPRRRLLVSVFCGW
jgi:hypothetical protein